MFLHDSHLPQLLDPAAYTSDDSLAREMQRLFLPSWQIVGTTTDLAHDGDFLTCELFGRPLIVWNSGGEYHTFLNVCPHRFARLTDKPCGHTGGRLVCQYHGWEFDCGGDTKKIPDAQSFKPMTRGALGLEKYRTETVGQLIFVNLSEHAPSLAEALGPAYEAAQELCSAEQRHFFTMDLPVAANWKTKIENALESYHVDLVHPTTFGRTPEAERCTHELADWGSTFASHEPCEQLLDRLVHRLIRREPDLEYKHWLVFPNLMFGKMRLFAWAEAILPVSPGKMRIRTWFFCYRGRSGGIRSRLLGRAMSRWGRKFFTKVSYEDAGILPEVQRGLAAPERPSDGVISIREERCWHFQEYVKGMTNGSNDQCERERVTRPH
ncbi:MAG: aromatic ring-hydroxylating dioxygenase subunit alpha [Planctomycetes bacterium]|nr:aromatic ring-hydroxylating dioxygenase subunit alpha [Planctomycetota bacterium]